MKFFSFLLLLLFAIIKNDFAQTVTGWDAAVTSQYGTNNYQLIGTFQGWDPSAVYIAGYNFYNNSSIATKRVIMGGITADLQYNNVGIGTTSPAYRLDVQGGNASIYNNSAATTFSIGSSLTGKTYLVLSTSADVGGYCTMQSVAASGSAYGNMVINPTSGNVLIGQATQGNSAYKLDVKDTIRTNQ